MYRQIFIPTENNSSIPQVSIPYEWYNEEVEMILFPVKTNIKSKKLISDDDFMKLCGAWESNESAEEMAANLRASRHFREKNLSL